MRVGGGSANQVIVVPRPSSQLAKSVAPVVTHPSPGRPPPVSRQVGVTALPRLLGSTGTERGKGGGRGGMRRPPSCPAPFFAADGSLAKSAAPVVATSVARPPVSCQESMAALQL